jgi:hypothetical protein
MKNNWLLDIIENICSLNWIKSNVTSEYFQDLWFFDSNLLNQFFLLFSIVDIWKQRLIKKWKLFEDGIENKTNYRSAQWFWNKEIFFERNFLINSIQTEKSLLLLLRDKNRWIKNQWPLNY